VSPDKQDMSHLTKPKKAVPIHYNGDTLFKSPLTDFKRAVEEAGLSDRLVYLSHGETYAFEVPAPRSAHVRATAVPGVAVVIGR
jgi:L-ascorbate metabolism protein UlaG (beta-lactamase superfamily)